MTARTSTSQNSAIFSRISSGTSWSARQQDDVRLDADAAQLLHGVLGRLRLELVRRADVRQQRHVDVQRSSRPTSLRIWRIASRNGWPSMSPTVPPTSTITTSGSPSRRDARDALLDLVRDVRDDLDRAAEEVAAALLGDDGLVDLAGRDVGALGQVLVDEALVVAEVEVGLGAVVGDEHLAVLVRRHRARIDVDVRVELQDGDRRPRP